MLHCKALTVTFERTRALHAVDLALANGEVVAIMGESGSGKSTLLRVIAGLVTPDSGSVHWNGRDLSPTPTHLRSFGLMFQDYALFPHLDVAANVGFGLRMQGVAAARRTEVVAQMLNLVGLDGYATRPVDELSGGEQQRVALARTLAPEPELVLLDEPLGALDRARRDQLLADMQTIFTTLGVTALYVTHDHNEAFAIAGRVAVLDRGRKIADASPRNLWTSPSHAAVATLLGFPILKDVAVQDGRARIGGSRVEVALPAGLHQLAIAPGAVAIDPSGPVATRVLATRFEGGVAKAIVELEGREVVADSPLDVVPGPARVHIDGSRLSSVAVTEND